MSLTAADTAFAIAFVRADEMRRSPSERLFEDPFARIFDAAGDHAREGTKRFIELPFFLDAVRLRTRALDEVVREALAAGTKQIVLLGAGFDMRAHRMPEIAASGATVIEVDLLSQLERKRDLLEAAGVSIPAHVKVVASDFSASAFDVTLARDLERAGFRKNEAAVFVWEGVIAYLDADAVDRTLRFVATAAGAGTRLAFELVPMAFDPPAEIRTKSAGFSRFQQISFDALWRKWLPGEPHPNAASLFVGVAFVDS